MAPPARRERTVYGTGRRERGSPTAARVLVAVPWAAFAIFIIVAGDEVFAVAVIALGILGMAELYQMLAPARPLQLAGFVGLAGLVLAAQYGDQFQIVLALALSVLFTFLMALARPERRHITLAMAVTMLGVAWIGLALAHAVLLRNLDHGGALLADTLIATFIGDTGAYFGGRFWGTRPLAPRLSPTKTVEGLVVGFVAGTVAFWFAGLYQDWLTHGEALALGACVAAAAPLGDLFESMIKRDLGVKDTGRVFGEHGGVLDRLDAAFFTVVVGYYAATAIL